MVETTTLPTLPDITTVRLAAQPAGRHGLDNRGLEAGAMPGFGYGRFGRMFPFSGRLLSDACLRAIANAMIKADPGKPITEDEPVDENPTIPAGYTYFGQFIDHDLTLDPTSLTVQEADVAALEDFRTPAFDLDCIYGRGPDDQPYMYEDGFRLRVGAPLTAQASIVATKHDVLRLKVSETYQPAILGDKRNDENRLVVQIQSLFIAFHNKVVGDEALIGAFGGDFSDRTSRFRTAVQITRWHYQWLIVNDFLKRILSPNTLSDILKVGAPPNIDAYQKPEAKYAYMPVEFAGAAYRFGHSMVRPSYALNTKVGTAHASDGPPSTSGRIPLFSRNEAPTENLNGFGVPLPHNFAFDWSFFLDNVAKPAGDFKIPQKSYRIDANLVDALADLPEFHDKPTPLGNLAYRNLVRGVANLRLPSGEQVARAFCINPLSPEVLWLSAGSRLLQPDTLSEELRAEFDEVVERRKAVYEEFVSDGGELQGATPLWYYILREAEHYGVGFPDEAEGEWGGQFLGPVGSRIVGQTFIGILWSDPTSYLRRHPLFEPAPPIADNEPFTLGRLATWTFS